MSVEKRKPRQLIWAKLAVLALMLGTSGLTITACQQSDTESESTEQEADGQPTGDKQTEDEPQTEADKKYEEEGKDTIDDDDPE